MTNEQQVFYFPRPLLPQQVLKVLSHITKELKCHIEYSSTISGGIQNRKIGNESESINDHEYPDEIAGKIIFSTLPSIINYNCINSSHAKSKGHFDKTCFSPNEHLYGIEFESENGDLEIINEIKKKSLEFFSR